MKTMKLYISLFIVLCCSVSIYSQGVSIELSAKWTKGIDAFNSDSIIYYPELYITYRNNSDTNYYFKKVSGSLNGYPKLSCNLLLQYPYEEYLNPNYLKRAKSHGNYADKSYDVVIGSSQMFKESWINNESDNVNVGDVINNDISDIYEYLYISQYGKNRNYKMFFTETDILNDGINETVISDFVFLKPNETFTDIYNLIAFQEVKGTFTFRIFGEKLFDYVLLNPIWDENQHRYIEKRIALPKEVSEYKLYSGRFNSNKITIAF